MEARYIVDEKGRRLSVVLPVEEYERMIGELEELEDARAVDEARAAIARGEEKLVPWEEVRKSIGTEHRDPDG